MFIAMIVVKFIMVMTRKRKKIMLLDLKGPYVYHFNDDKSCKVHYYKGEGANEKEEKKQESEIEESKEEEKEEEIKREIERKREKERERERRDIDLTELIETRTIHSVFTLTLIILMIVTTAAFMHSSIRD